MEGKKTNLLTCELESMKTDGTTASEARDFLHPFLQQVCAYPDTTIEMVLNPLRDLNELYSGVLDKEVDLLKRKLGVTNNCLSASLLLLLWMVKMETSSFPRFMTTRRASRNRRIWPCL